MKEGQQDTVMAEGDIEILKEEMLIGDGDVVVVKEEVMDEQEVVVVKGEPLDYFEGFSLATEEDLLAVPSIGEAKNNHRNEPTTEGPSASIRKLFY